MAVAEVVVTIALAAVAAHGLIGLAVAAWLLAGRIREIDPGLAEAGIGVRFVLLPGMVALWPLILARWQRRQREPDGAAVAPAEIEASIARHPRWVLAVALVAAALAAAGLATRPAEPRAASLTDLAAWRGETLEDARGTAHLAPDGNALAVSWEARDASHAVALYWVPLDASGQPRGAARLVGALGETGTYRFDFAEAPRAGAFQLLRPEARP